MRYSLSNMSLYKSPIILTKLIFQQNKSNLDDKSARLKAGKFTFIEFVKIYADQAYAIDNSLF